MGDDDLKTGAGDIAAMVTRLGVGQIPVYGPIIAEVITYYIPGQKLDRVASFVRELAGRVGDMEERQAVFASRLQGPEGSDLLEEGLVQSSRAIHGERRERIAAILANGLTAEILQYDRTKRLLAIHASLTDSEVLLLHYYSRAAAIGSQWHRDLQAKYPDLLRPVSREKGRSASEAERGALRDNYERHLLTEGLLEEAGPAGFRLSVLGRLLLEQAESL